MSRTIIRLIGETDIVDIDPASHDGGAHSKLMGLDADAVSYTHLTLPTIE